MKKMLKYICFGLGCAMLLVGCNDSFMERYPLDKITDQNYWQSEDDLKNYVNALYPSYIVGFGEVWQDGTLQPRGHNVAATVYGDIITDNAAPNSFSRVSANQYTAYLTGTSAGIGYNFRNIRTLNIFIQNYNRVQIDQNKKNQYLGEVLFFKAWDYFDKVKNWGEVPWLSRSLETNDTDIMQGPRTERGELLDSIIACVDKAIEYLPNKGSEANNRLNKEMALFLKARIGLYEGTFRKYHNLNLDADKYLRYATEASEKLMQGQYNLVQGNKDEVYFHLFATEDYTGNPEVILWRQYSANLTYGSAFSRYYTQNNRHQFGATRSLVDEYLCVDGLPISSSAVFEGKSSLSQELKNRDPRLTQTIADFGTYNLAVGVSQGAENAPLPNIQGLTGNKCPTGYRVAKWWLNNPTDWDRTTNGQQAGLMWRYAEVLLNYAEAKFELGEMSQNVLDMTINKLRERVGMPSLSLGMIPNDERLDNIYSKYVGYSLNPVLREIRRERRVEMAFENTRWDDLVRWKAGKLLEVPIEGIKFNQSEFPNVVVDKDVFLSAEGFILPYNLTLPDGIKWDDKQYLFPFTIEELVLNKGLKQNPGWEAP